MSAITVLINCADTFFYASLRTVLDNYGGMSLIDSVSDGDEQLLRVLRDSTPDVLLLDWQSQGGDEASLLQRIQAASPGTKTVLFCDFFDHFEVIKVLVHGAKGCIRKASSPAQWFKAIHVIQGGDIWIDRKLLVDALNVLLYPAPIKCLPLESKPDILTPREWEVVHRVGEGMTNKEIARRMIISTSTVKTHLQNIYSKLKVGRRIQLPLA